MSHGIWTRTNGTTYAGGMTVAAVILSATAEGALTETAGQPRVRRLADLAWSGGALPIVVLSPDPDGTVAGALAGTEAIHGSPAPEELGPAGQMARGIELAASEVRDVSAALIWPARLVWVGPETVTSLIEAHGTEPGAMLRPTWHGEPGWPVLLPLDHLAALQAIPPDRMPPAIIDELAGRLPTRLVELGDPGRDPRRRHGARGPAGLRGSTRPAGRAHPRMGRRRRRRSRTARTRRSVTRFGADIRPRARPEGRS